MVIQMAVFIENRKGRILELTNVLKNNGVDLISLSVADTKDFGILRIIARDNAKAEKALKDAGFTVTTTKLFGVEAEDKPGGLADILALLESNDINVEYIYAFANAQAKKGTVLFKVSDEALTAKILKSKNIKLLDNNLL